MQPSDSDTKYLNGSHESKGYGGDMDELEDSVLMIYKVTDNCMKSNLSLNKVIGEIDKE